MKGFASDNYAGVHPAMLEALSLANNNHATAYGGDKLTDLALKELKKEFGSDSESFFVFNGTAANILSLSSIVQSHQAVICAETAHINCDECGAPEAHIGCKLLTIATGDGKLSPEQIKPFLHVTGIQHHSQPKAISVSQPTELGTLYTLEELRNLAQFAHLHGLLLHIDGARISNAAAALGCSLAATTSDIGADVLSFGGTKNGLMYGEAVVFFKPELALDFIYRRKQAMQLASKMRYISAQFLTYLNKEQWRQTATHANRMANMLASEISKIPQIQITQKVECNGVFAIVPDQVIAKLQDRYFFYVWNETNNEVRWMTSWDTTEDDILNFTGYLKELLLEIK